MKGWLCSMNCAYIRRKQIMEIHWNEKADKPQFELIVEGKKEGEMTFYPSGPGKFTIDHTEVFPGNEGKGYGKLLVEAGVAKARELHVKIQAICPYAAKVIEKNSAFHDILF